MSNKYLYIYIYEYIYIYIYKYIYIYIYVYIVCHFICPNRFLSLVCRQYPKMYYKHLNIYM